MRGEHDRHGGHGRHGGASWPSLAAASTSAGAQREEREERVQREEKARVRRDEEALSSLRPMKTSCTCGRPCHSPSCESETRCRPEMWKTHLGLGVRSERGGWGEREGEGVG